MEMELDLNPTCFKFFLQMIKIGDAQNPKNQFEKWTKGSIKDKTKKFEPRLKLLLKSRTKQK